MREGAQLEAYIDLVHEKQTRLIEVTNIIGTYRFLESPSQLPVVDKFNFSQLYLVYDGDGVLITEWGEFPIAPGMMLYLPAGKASSYQWHSSKAHYDIINFVCESEVMSVFARAPLQLQEEEQLALQEVMDTASRVSVYNEAERPLIGVSIKADTPGIVLSYIMASLERFLALVYSRVTGSGIAYLTDESQKAGVHIERTDLVSKIEKYLVENKRKKIKMEDICKEFLVCQTTLKQKFQREMGMSPMEYLTELRIREAKLRVRESSATFSEIADDLGFSSVNYFYKVFKAKTGMTPTEYSRFVSKRRSPGK